MTAWISDPEFCSSKANPKIKKRKAKTSRTASHLGCALFHWITVPPMSSTGNDLSKRVERVQKAPRSLKKAISHQSIDKVKAMGAIIRRKFSKDLRKGKTVSADDEVNAPDSPNMADDLAER